MQQTEAHPEILLTLPPWLIALVRPPRFCPTVEERMAFVIRIARENV